MRLDMHDHVEVARLAPGSSRSAARAHADSSAVANAGRDANLDLLLPALHAGPAARFARRRDDAPLTTAPRARAHEREQALVVTDRSRPAALRTRLDRGPWLGARSAAGRARRV